MKSSQIVGLVSVVVFGFILVLSATAQPLGVLQSAETMDQGAFKIMVAPVMALGKNGADDEIGVTVRGGYGFTDRFDVEAKVGFFDASTVVGLDGEYWLLRNLSRNPGMDFSLAGGIHFSLMKNNPFDVFGIDLIPQLSGNLTKNLELCGAMIVSFESIQDLPAGLDNSYTTLHFVPGIEYRLADSFDLEGEFGIGLNDDSYSYVGVGIAYYLR